MNPISEKTIVTGSVDNLKKAKLLLLALLITVSMFVIRSWELINLASNREIFSVSIGYFIFTFVGLVVAFKFQVNRKSLFFVLPQSSFFVASEFLFIMMFFFRSFERVYDFVFLLMLLIIVLFATYAIFLMANVLNVATFKPLPLLQVATTSSYFATILMIYFISFAISSLTIPVPVMLGMLFVVYLAVLFFQYYQISTTMREAFSNSFISAIVSTIGLSTVLIMGPHHELSALVPTSIVFGLIGLEMAEKKAQIQRSTLIQYIIIVLAAFLVNIFLNVS